MTTQGTRNLKTGLVHLILSLLLIIVLCVFLTFIPFIFNNETIITIFSKGIISNINNFYIGFSLYFISIPGYLILSTLLFLAIVYIVVCVSYITGITVLKKEEEASEGDNEKESSKEKEENSESNNERKFHYERELNAYILIVAAVISASISYGLNLLFFLILLGKQWFIWCIALLPIILQLMIYKNWYKDWEIPREWDFSHSYKLGEQPSINE